MHRLWHVRIYDTGIVVVDYLRNICDCVALLRTETKDTEVGDTLFALRLMDVLNRNINVITDAQGSIDCSVQAEYQKCFGKTHPSRIQKVTRVNWTPVHKCREEKDAPSESHANLHTVLTGTTTTTLSSKKNAKSIT